MDCKQLGCSDFEQSTAMKQTNCEDFLLPRHRQKARDGWKDNGIPGGDALRSMVRLA